MKRASFKMETRCPKKKIIDRSKLYRREDETLLNSELAYAFA